MCKKCESREVWEDGYCMRCYAEIARKIMKPSEKIKMLVEDGTLQEMLDMDLTIQEIAMSIKISASVIQRAIAKYDLKFSKPAKCKPKKDKLVEIKLSPAQKIALATPWVKSSTDRYYYPI